MANRLAAFCAFLTLTASAGFSQISFPGQYPPGQYPPGQYPPGQYPPGGRRNPQTGQPNGQQVPSGSGRRRGSSSKDESVSTQNMTGTIRRLTDTELVLEPEDRRIISIALAKPTVFQKASGAETAKAADFQPGDVVSVAYTQDDKGYYHSARISMVKQGSADDYVRASEPVDTNPVLTSSDDSSNSGDDDRPRLRRPGAPSASASAAEAPAPPTRPQSTVRPQITEGDPLPARPAAPDPDDPGPPQLRRGMPSPSARRSTPAQPPAPDRSSPPAPVETADARRPLQPPEDREPEFIMPTGKVRPDEDNAITKAREAAATFSESLPNYQVKQVTTRYSAESARGARTNWQPIDNVTADVYSEGGKESYKNILVNGKKPKEAVEKTGLWSTGDFSSILLDVLSPATDADFHNKRSTTMVNRAAWRFDYSVERENSHWHVYAAAESYVPAYSGSIWIDKETFRVLRVELSAQGLPKGFPFDAVESSLDYDFVSIGTSRFLLPVHSEALNCQRGSGCGKNVIDFRNYKKFGSESSIDFGAPADK